MLARSCVGLGSVAIALCLSGCSKSSTVAAADKQPQSTIASSSPTAEGLPDRDTALAHRLFEDEGALLLDVRTSAEFAAGHIDGAKNVPHGEIEARIDEIAAMVDGDKDTPIVLYCRSGRRAGIAKDALLGHGFGRVTNLGGMSNW